MKGIRKIISILAALALCSTLAFAADSSPAGLLIAALNNSEGNGVVKLEQDYKLKEREITINSGTNVTLDLNGHTIDRGLTGENGSPVDNGYVIYIQSGASLTITDSSMDKSGKITGGNKTGSGGGIYVDGGELTIEAGSICGNKAGDNAGGIYIESGKVTMNGGKIYGNEAGKYGGGIYVGKIETGTFVMTDGSIYGNSAGYGGGAAVDGSFSMKGGSISGNTAKNLGSGVYYFIFNSGSSMEVSGNCKIKDNFLNGSYDDSTGMYTGDSQENLYIGAFAYSSGEEFEGFITIGESGLSPEAEIGVRVDYSRVFTKDTGDRTVYASNLVSDFESYVVKKVSSGEYAFLYKVTARADPYTEGVYYATYYESDRTYVADCEVYYATSKDGENFKLQKAEGNIIKAGAGVILKSTGSTITLMEEKEAAHSYTSILTGTDSERTVTPEDGVFVLSVGESGVGFYRYSGEIAPNKAYFEEQSE